MRERDYWRIIDEADKAPTAEKAALYYKAAAIALDVSQRMAQEAIEARKAAVECRRENESRLPSNPN